MTEPLPVLNTRVLERYVDARVSGIVARLIAGYRDHTVTERELYGAAGAFSELKWLLDDAKRIQQQQGQEEIRLVSTPDYGRRTPHG